jgi:hypothetical protein
VKRDGERQIVDVFAATFPESYYDSGSSVEQIAVTPDARLALTVSRTPSDNRVLLRSWRLDTGTISRDEASSVPGRISGISPDGRWLTYATDYSTFARNLSTSSDVRLALEASQLPECWCEDWFVAQRPSGITDVYDVAANERLVELASRPRQTALLMLAGLAVYTIPLEEPVLHIRDCRRPWSAVTEEPLPFTVACLAAMPDRNRVLIVPGEGQSLFILDLATGAMGEVMLNGNIDEPFQSDASVTDDLVLLRSHRGCQVWDLRTGAKTMEYTGNGWLAAAVIAPDLHSLVIAEDRAIKVIDLRSAETKAAFNADEPVIAVAAAGSLIIAGSSDSRIHRLELKGRLPTR